MLHQLDPYKHEQKFLSTFLSLVDLGSFIDNRALADYIGRTPVVQQYRPPSFMREMNAGARYVISELAQFLQGTEVWSIHAGVSFARYVVVFMIHFPTLRNTTRFLVTFSLEKFRLRLQCYAGSWSLSQVLLLWHMHSNGKDHSTE